MVDQQHPTPRPAPGAAGSATPGATSQDGPGPDSPGDHDRVQRRTLIVLVVMQVIGTVGVGIAPSIGVLLAGEVTENEAWAGLARTASTLGAALVGLPLGNLAARFGRRVALTCGWWVAAAGSALLVLAAQASLIAPLFIGLLLIGAGSAVSMQARFAATDLARPERRGRSLALIVWVGTLGSVLGPNLGVPGKAIGEQVGLNVYAGAFAIAAIFLALAGLIVFGWLRPDPLLVLHRSAPVTPAESVDPRRRPNRIGMILAELRVNPSARFAVIAILTAQIVMVAIMTMTPVHLTHQGGSITIIGLTISLHVAGMFGLAPVVGQLADRVGPRPTIAAGVAIFLASLLIGAVRSEETGWIMASLLLLGLGWSFVNVSASALFTASISDHTRASSQGGVDALSNLCGASAALVSGPLLAATSFPALSVLTMVVLVPLTVLLVTGVVAARSGRGGARP